MKEEKDIWIDQVMESHKGKALLETSELLFDNILRQTIMAKPISVRHMSFVGIAASMLILINCVAIQSINNSGTSETAGVAYDAEFISDYNLYDYE